MFAQKTKNMLSIKEEKKPIDLFQRKKQVFIFRFCLSILIIFLDISVFDFPKKNLSLLSFSIILFFLSLPLFKKEVFSFFKEKKLNIDFLGIITLLSSFILCLVFTFFKEEKFYFCSFFSTFSLIVLFFSLAKLLEAQREKEDQEEIEKFPEIFPQEVKIIRQGKETTIPLTNVSLSDLVIIYPNEKIPIDGIVIEGHSHVDESLLTGQTFPQEKEFGSEIISGSTNLKGVLKIKPMRQGENSLLFEVINLVKKAKLKEEIPHLSDRIIVYLFPIFLTFILCIFFLEKFSFEFSLFETFKNILYLLIFICPLGFLFSDLFPFIIISNFLLKKGILIKGRRALEKIAKLTMFIFDKTKTLTFGKLKIDQIIPFSPAGFYSERDVLEIAASLERDAQTSLAGVILDKAKSEGIRWLERTEIRRRPGFGVEGKVFNKETFLGGIRLAKEKGIDLSSFEKKIKEIEGEGKTILLLGVENKPAGFLVISDLLRQEAIGTIEKMKKMKIKILIITGDNFKTTKITAEKLGIEKILAELSPGEKEEEIKKLQLQKEKIGIIGSGWNDIPAMIEGNVCFALNEADCFVKKISKVIFLENNLLLIPMLMDFSKKFWKKVKINFFLSFFWNIVGIVSILIFSFLFSETAIPFLINLIIILGIGSVFLNSFKVTK